MPDTALTAVLPVPTATSAQLQQLFGAKGFSARELVALSGAHAIGSSQFTAPVVRQHSEPQARHWHQCLRRFVSRSRTIVSKHQHACCTDQTLGSGPVPFSMTRVRTVSVHASSRCCFACDAPAARPQSQRGCAELMVAGM